jgi:hypothetical protein
MRDTEKARAAFVREKLPHGFREGLVPAWGRLLRDFLAHQYVVRAVARNSAALP